LHMIDESHVAATPHALQEGGSAHPAMLFSLSERTVPQAV